MDRTTLAIYETQARRYESARTPSAVDLARQLAGRIRPGGIRFDLGCGPGWYGPALGQPLVAVDAARAMLTIVPEHAPGALPVRADLTALPFRRLAGAGAWAAKSYVHVARGELPLALWDLHRVLEVGAPVVLTMFEGDGEARWADDDLTSDAIPAPGAGASPAPGGDRGRLYSHWRPDHLVDVVRGAGFEEVTVERFEQQLAVSAVRARALADTVRPGLRLLLVGLNPSLVAADAGYGFAGPSNRFWPALAAAGIHQGARNPRLLATELGIGMTDLAKRATRRADEVHGDEFVQGLARINRLATWLTPDVVCFVGLAGWRAAVDRRAQPGWQERPVGGRPAYVMPNPSGLNAHETVDSLAAHFRVARAGPPRAP